MNITSRDCLDTRLEVFVTEFVNYVEKEIESHTNNAVVSNNEPENVSGSMIDLCLELAVDPLSGTGTIAKKNFNAWSGENQKKDYRLVKDLFRFIPKETRVPLFLEAAGELFMSYEYPLMSVTGGEGGSSWMTGVEMLASDAADRFMSQIISTKDDLAINMQNILKYVQSGESKSGLISSMFPKWAKTDKICSTKPGFKININGKGSKTSDVYEKLGVVTVKDHGMVDKIYGENMALYRRIFSWESTKGMGTPQDLDTTYVYQLTSEDLGEKLHKYLEKMTCHNKELRDLASYTVVKNLDKKVDDLLAKLSVSGEYPREVERIVIHGAPDIYGGNYPS